VLLNSADHDNNAQRLKALLTGAADLPGALDSGASRNHRTAMVWQAVAL
jgi:hypothetical protein